ncbi:PEP-CTERM sorting domain-containing protein [Amantichitinum ursilacus]|uniref:PEP-CTERM motif protein n=1 Tax=Amantichitinum ursilacus TaxID=857265 RepID=A0A0N0GR71_9NEIS|nr:PEP-CTERM sorting domain-containing protein [Amantichitinum ursilacus]KPC55159.1 PEP-CTERM motif protein [Amantichitinum ursilacus]
MIRTTFHALALAGAIATPTAMANTQVYDSAGYTITIDSTNYQFGYDAGHAPWVQGIDYPAADGTTHQFQDNFSAYIHEVDPGNINTQSGPLKQESWVSIQVQAKPGWSLELFNFNGISGVATGASTLPTFTSESSLRVGQSASDSREVSVEQYYNQTPSPTTDWHMSTGDVGPAPSGALFTQYGAGVSWWHNYWLQDCATELCDALVGPVTIQPGDVTWLSYTGHFIWDATAVANDPTAAMFSMWEREGVYPHLDVEAMSPVPEPETWALFGLGLVGLSARGWRKRRAGVSACLV